MSLCVSELGVYLLSSSKIWVVLYICCVLPLSLLTSLTLHLMVLGLLICGLAYVKLPSPSPERVAAVLGSLHHSSPTEAGPVVVHRAACLDA